MKEPCISEVCIMESIFLLSLYPETISVMLMSTTTHSQYAASLKEFSVETEMTDVEILRVSHRRILARGKRFGRMWLLRGLPPEERNDPALLRQLQEEFDRRFSRLEPGAPLTVGLEHIECLGPCIVEEWREDYHDRSSMAENEDRRRKRRLIMRRAVILILAFISCAGALGVGLHIRRLTALSERAKADLEALSLVNRQSEERMFLLADSLDRVLQYPMFPEEFSRCVEIREEDREQRMADALYQTRVKDFKKVLVRFDRDVIPGVVDHPAVYYDSVCAIYRCMMDMAADVDPYGRFPQLPEDERIRLTSKLYGGFMNCVGIYMKGWIQMVKASKEKKNKNGHGKNEGENERSVEK